MVGSFIQLHFFLPSSTTTGRFMSSKQNQPQLYRCEPVDWLWLPKPVRIALGWVVATIFSLTFLSIPICAIFLVPSFWRTFPKLATFLLASVFLSVLLPPKEWKIMRRVPQLLYELYDFSCNLSPETCRKLVMEGDFKQYIIGMHPHGIVPIQALLWTAYCDQYMHIDDRALYGFGAAADVVNYIPFLRNIMVSLPFASLSLLCQNQLLTGRFIFSWNRVG